MELTIPTSFTIEHNRLQKPRTCDRVAGLLVSEALDEEALKMSRRDFHTTELIGRLAVDPIVTYGESKGTPITRLRVLVNEQWRDQSGREQKHVEAYAVLTFNGLAEACGSYLAAGRRVFVRGRNRTRSYEKDGAKRYVTELLADTVLFLDGPKEPDTTRPPYARPPGTTKWCDRRGGRPF